MPQCRLGQYKCNAPSFFEFEFLFYFRCVRVPIASWQLNWATPAQMTKQKLATPHLFLASKMQPDFCLSLRWVGGGSELIWNVSQRGDLQLWLSLDVLKVARAIYICMYIHIHLPGRRTCSTSIQSTMYLQLQCLDTQNFASSVRQSRAISSTARKRPNRIFILVGSFMQMYLADASNWMKGVGECECECEGRLSTSQIVSDLDAPHFTINSDIEDKRSSLSFAFKVLPYGQQYSNIIGGKDNTNVVYVPHTQTPTTTHTHCVRETKKRAQAYRGC